MFNLHTHTYRCNHASGKDEEYVIKAIENGYSTIGFSDHAPYLFPNGYVSSFRMLPNEAEGYAKSINSLKEKYKGKIDIKLGLELEYYPALFKKEIEFLKTFNYDYLILGQHYVDNEYEDYAIYSDSPTKSTAVLDKYISQVILINFKGDSELYIKKMTYMITELKKIGIPLEFNFLGFTAKRNYPNLDFWKIVSKVGNDVVIGLDAHSPSVYDDKENLQKAKQILQNLNITPLDKIEL